MKITAVHVRDYKRIKDVRITPDADRTIILLGGKNGQGKSSTLDALTAAFGGKKSQAADPVRHGAETAEITVELDGGELVIKRIIKPDGDSALEVRDRFGAVKAPQAILDRLVGARFLDPLAFLTLPAKEQRSMLMRLIKDADRIGELDAKRERVFKKRTEVGRDQTKAEGELGRLEEVKVEAPIDIAALTNESRKLTEQQRESDALGLKYEETKRALMDAKNKLTDVDDEIEELEKRLLVAKSKRPAAAEAHDAANAAVTAAKTRLDEAAAAWTEVAPRRTTIDNELARAADHNRAVYAAEERNKRRAETAETVATLTKEWGDLSKVLEAIDARKAEILSAAKLPVEGLSVDENGVTLNGVPFAQASDAEKWRVALALAIAASPGLGDVWIRDGALLDEESLELVAKHAAGAGKRCWIERVSDRDPGVIVIHDGQVAS